MKFKFEAKTKTGEKQTGLVNAANRDLAAAILQKNELFPIHIEEDVDNLAKKVFAKYYDRVTDKELVIFFRQLAILIEARVPIVVALTAIEEQTSGSFLKIIINEAIKDIEDGVTLSDALAKHKEVFSNLAINIVKAGEASGNLKKSVEYVADNIEKNYELTSKVKSAMTYPLIVLVVFFIIAFLVITLIIPKLTVMIKDLGADVPWYTRLLINTGDFMAVYWWAVLLMIAGIIGGIIYYLNTIDGRKEWDQIKLKLPVVGVMFRYVYITRFSENLAVLLAGGIPIIKSITIVSAVIGNTVYEELFLRTAENVKRGENMSDVLKRSSLIPPMVSHMIKIGEDSGQIDSVLGHITKFYGQEVELMAKNMSTLIEPILMIIIGTGVGLMAVGVLMPIYNIAGQIK
ncbi:MAG: type II secretion system F family protein [Candidatus Moranbacteria bacterium]|nr:type II secretion system F family protein [Candidatus Moranbacteria bacterium]